MKESQSDDIDWDFYFYVGMTLLNWNLAFFLQATPNHLMKQYITHIKANNPDAIKEDIPARVYTLDQTPFM